MGELFTATRRLLVQELGKWVMRDTFDKAVNYKLYVADAAYEIGRVSDVSRDGTYVFRIAGSAPGAPDPSGYIRVYRYIPVWKKDVTYVYSMARGVTFDTGTYLEMLYHQCIGTPYVWGIRFEPKTGKWLYLTTDAEWVEGDFTFTPQQSDEMIHYGFTVNPQDGKYAALYVRGQRYDIHTLEPCVGSIVITAANYFSYGLYLASSSGAKFHFDEVGVAVL